MKRKSLHLVSCPSTFFLFPSFSLVSLLAEDDFQVIYDSGPYIWPSLSSFQTLLLSQILFDRSSILCPNSFVQNYSFNVQVKLCLVAQPQFKLERPGEFRGRDGRDKAGFPQLLSPLCLPSASPVLPACEAPSMILVSLCCSCSLGSAMRMACSLLLISFGVNTLLLYLLSGPHSPAWYCNTLLSVF